MEKSTTKSEENRKMKKTERTTLFFVVLGLFLAIFCFFWWLFRQPSYGTVNLKEPEQVTVDETKVGKRRFDGKYVTFFYPADFSEKKFDAPVKDPMLERFLASRGDIEGRKIALIVQDTTGSSFEEFSSYRIREQDEKVYQKEKITKNGLDITIFTKDTGVFEVGAFVGSGNRVASLVLSSPFGLGDMRADLFSILETFAWRSEN